MKLASIQVRAALLAASTVFAVQNGANAQKQAPSVQLEVSGGHLQVPVYNPDGREGQKAGNVRLGIFLGKDQVQNFNVTLPLEGEPYWMATYPLEHFDLQGKTVTIKATAYPKVGRDGTTKLDPKAWEYALGKIAVGDDFPEESASDYAQPYRNQFHATTRRGWIQDPNGMVYHNGIYHLYYQYNPFGIWPANKHWGHWTSKDLIHWEEKPIVLFTDLKKGAAFSGGGFVDFNNSLGLGANTLCAAYTATKLGECIVYSTDDGLTLKEIEQNPVVKHEGRDPKVIWYEPEKKWVLMVYNLEEGVETKAVPTTDESKFRHSNMAFYESKDLRVWKRTGAFTDPDRMAVFECPEIFELGIEGESGSRWILYGGQNRYFIGDFNGKTFVKESGPFGADSGPFDAPPYSAHGAFYAAQTFSDVPDGRRIQMGWLRAEIAYLKDFPNQMTSQAMSLPHELKLLRTAEGLRMAFVPVEEVKMLRAEKLGGLDGCKGELTEVLIEFEDDGPHEIMINGIDASFEGRSARIFNDRTFVEIYANGGLDYTVRARQPEAWGSEETAVKSGKVKSLEVYRLKSIWAGK